jgi:drug/metabolite transporter (DMT)-like permease
MQKAAVVRMRILIVAVLSAIYATCYAAVKAGLPFAPPLWFGGLRALIAGLALFGLMIIVRLQLFPARREWPLLLTLALTGTAFPTVVWYWLHQGGDVGRLVLFLFLVPVFGLVVGTFLFGEKLGLLGVIGVVVTVSGIAVAAWPGGKSPPQNPREQGE